jgi:lysophospholipase L1-like esterase
MRIVNGVALIMFMGTRAVAQDVQIDPQNHTVTADMHALAVRVGGRVNIAPLPAPLPAGAASYTHAWPGIYFEAAFTGDRLTLRFDDPSNEYRLFIDALPPITLAQPGRSEVTVSGLANAPHAIRLEKVTESIWITAAFQGFYIPATATPDATSPRQRQIEFIGDSDMTGYGIRSDTRICTQEEVRLRSDTQIAYPALVAKHFDADYQINAISGRGAARNYEGMAPDHTMADIYPYTLPDEDIAGVTPIYADAEWHPQIYVVALGGNDFATPLKPGEAWADDAALVDAFLASYIALLTTLHQRSPDAALLIFWTDGPMLTEAEKADLTPTGRATLLAGAQNAGFTSVDFIALNEVEQDASACDYHSSRRDHAKRAAWLITYLDAHPALWPAPAP